MKRNITILSDFDGTITNKDVINCIIHYYSSNETVEQLNNDINSGKIGITEFMDFVCSNLDLKDLDTIVRKYDIQVDPGFRDFYNDCGIKNIPFYILSGGLKNVIYDFIPYVDPQRIISNSVTNHVSYITPELHPKSKFVLKIKNTTGSKVYYIGDGSSDFSVIPFVDVLFVKKDSELHKKCNSMNVHYETFETFNDIKTKIFKV